MVYLDPTFAHYPTNGSSLRGRVGLVLERTWDNRNYGEGYWYRVLAVSDIMYFEEYELTEFRTGIPSHEPRGTV
jgi:hypothetical protein